MPRTLNTLAGLLLLLAAVSCKQQDPLVGTWIAVDTGVGPSGFQGMKLELRPNGTYTANVAGVELIGQWQVNGDTLVLIARTMNGRDVDDMGDMGASTMTDPLTLQISPDKAAMTSAEPRFNSGGNIRFTKG